MFKSCLCFVFSRVDNKMCLLAYLQKQPIRGVLRKRCSEIMQQIYNLEITPRHGYSPVNLLHIFKHLFLRTLLDGCFSIWLLNTLSLTYSLDYSLTHTNLQTEWHWLSLTYAFTYLEKQAKSCTLCRQLLNMENFKIFCIFIKQFCCFPMMLFLFSFYVVLTLLILLYDYFPNKY